MERSKDFKQGFIFTVTLGYNYDASLGNSVDIGKKKTSLVKTQRCRTGKKKPTDRQSQPLYKCMEASKRKKYI